MVSRRIVIAGLAGAALIPSLARAQAHWLIGEWVGQRDLAKGTRYGSDRTLTVARVAADGKSAQGVWTSSGKLTVKVTIEGDQIGFNTASSADPGAVYKLEHKGDTLSGSFVNQGDGKSGAITLTRKK